MNLLNKKIITTIMLLSSLTLFADDFSDDSGFGDDSSFGSFGDDFGSSSASEVEFSGEVNIGATAYFADDILEESAEFYPEASITLNYTGSLADLTIVTDMTTDEITLDEIYTSIYAEKFNAEVGLLKTVWGKGDKLHVVDLLNSTDYSNYFTEDYLESKKATAMVKFNVPLGETGVLELAYVPLFEGDTIPTDSIWTPYSISTLMSAYNLTSENVEGMIPDMDTLKNGQAGLRLTGTIGSFDLGTLYYYGYDKQPNVTSTLELEYERMQMFGIEAGKVLGGFNLRAEGAYYLMDDSDNSLNYVAGFDYNLPLNNLNLNIQIKGNYMLDSDEDNTNLLVGKLSDTYNHEKVSASVTGLYYIEDGDYMIKPEVSTTLGDTLTVEFASGIFFGEDDTTLGQYDDNDYLSVNLKYMF